MAQPCGLSELQRCFTGPLSPSSFLRSVQLYVKAQGSASLASNWAAVCGLQWRRSPL